PQVRQADLLKERQGRPDRHERQDRRVAHLPAGGAWLRDEVWLKLHGKPRLRIIAPPSRQTRQRHIAAMLLVHKTARDGAGAAVQIFVRAPHGKIDLPVVESQWHVADRMGKIEADYTARLPGSG